MGQAVHVGGLVRLDLDHASVETIYITIWASPNVSLHLGKIDNAEEIRKSHIGVRLQVCLSCKSCKNCHYVLMAFLEIGCQLKLA